MVWDIGPLARVWPGMATSICLIAPDRGNKDRSAPAPTEGTLTMIGEVLKFLFSWIVLLPIGVIVSGKLLAQRFRLPDNMPQQLKIQLRGVVLIQSNNGEVILGFAAFIITLLLIGVSAGRDAYEFFSSHFGIDPGFFNALCILSSFTAVLWSAAIYLISAQPRPSETAEHEKLIDKLGAKAQEEKEKSSGTTEFEELIDHSLNAEEEPYHGRQ